MSPPPTQSEAAGSLRQMVRIPRESDGVGNALRQVFGGVTASSRELGALLNRLDRND